MRKIIALILLFATCLVGCNMVNEINVEEPGKNTKPQGPNIVEYGAASAETQLSNTFKLLCSGEKKLTIGYLGGSITSGSTAAQIVAKQKGDIALSYVNRVSNWFKEEYPDATIETVNAGVSDTATNYGIFRLETTLMNEKGHDMPDLVFVEYTSNDWFYDTQSKDEVLIQIESLIRNIWDKNPYAEIVFLSTQVAFKSDSVKAYKEIAEKYNIPFIDVGTPLRRAKKEKCGNIDESSGTYYYTTDNLHPSAAGFQVYFDTIQPVLKELLTFDVKDWKLYDYRANLSTPYYKNLITNPQIVTVDSLTFSGDAVVAAKPISVSMYDTMVLGTKSIKIVENCIDVTGKTTITGKFSGTALGFLFEIKGGKKSFKLRYQIDGGEWKELGVNSKSWAFQMYSHSQVFMLSHDLGDGGHTVNIEFDDDSQTFFGGLLVNSK